MNLREMFGAWCLLKGAALSSRNNRNGFAPGKGTRSDACLPVCALEDRKMSIPEGSTRTQAISTGIGGFDGILDGGYASHRVHLIEGQPGTGKTTLALQFLLDGVSKGERCLYITLSESKD
jgi:predicted ATP-dependent serine protease